MEPRTCPICRGTIQPAPTVVDLNDPDAARKLAAVGTLIGHEKGCIEASPFVPHDPGTCFCDPCEHYWLRALFGPSGRPPNERRVRPVPDLDEALEAGGWIESTLPLVEQSNRAEAAYLRGSD